MTIFLTWPFGPKAVCVTMPNGPPATWPWSTQALLSAGGAPSGSFMASKYLSQNVAPT